MEDMKKGRVYTVEDGIYPDKEVEAKSLSKHNPWHTGTPTEKGWYLLACNIGNSSEFFYAVDYWSIETKQWTINRVVAWQKIEPYKGK